VPFVPRLVHLAEGGEENPDDWSMTSPLTWTGTFRGNVGRLRVEASEAEPFVTDLASVPQSLTWLVPRYGKYTKAAILHDYLCQTVGKETIAVYRTPTTAAKRDASSSDVQLIRLEDRSDADEIFRLAMTELGVPWAQRWLMWSAASVATLWTSLWPGRSSRPMLRWIGRAMLAAIPVVAALLLWAYAADWFVGDADWRWLRILALAVLGTTVVIGTLLAAGYVALGRWDRAGVYLAALVVTLSALPVLAVVAMIYLYRLLYELPRSLFLRVFRREPRPAPTAARAARLQAVRAS
jgi:Protein of unknown function (DUF1353)